jgi:hypothetical protein
MGELAGQDDNPTPRAASPPNDSGTDNLSGLSVSLRFHSAQFYGSDALQVKTASSGDAHFVCRKSFDWNDFGKSEKNFLGETQHGASASAMPDARRKFFYLNNLWQSIFA